MDVDGSVHFGFQVTDLGDILSRTDLDDVPSVTDSDEMSINLIYPVRSDGALEVGTGPSKRPNRPTDEQLQKQAKNGIITWWEFLPPEDPRHLEWLRKLGTFLKQKIVESARQFGGTEMSAHERNSQWILATLPENYHLWDRCRIAEDPNKKDEIRERRDPYLYGHPSGRIRRYRSPNDFFAHFWWLTSDLTGDPANCECKNCTPDDLIEAASKIAVTHQGDKTQLPGFAQELVNKAMKKAEKKSAKKASKREEEEEEEDASPALLPATTPMPRVQALHPEQFWDQQSNSYLYRLGELVWFIRDTNALALGAVVSRSTLAGGMGHSYRIQPLSFPNRPESQVDFDHERNMYPWLAFSTPECLNASLRGVSDHFDNINWDLLPQDENTVVDGSIFGAKAVDESFTLVQPLTLPGTPTMEFEYNGIYLGGELIWAGDAIRYYSEGQPQPHLAVICKIIERIHTGSKPSEIYALVDVYELEVHSPGQETSPPPDLPIRVLDDLKYRSDVRKRVWGETLTWKFMTGQLRIPIKNIVGRWYESRRMLRIIKPDFFEQALRHGDIPDCGAYLNSRGNSLPQGSIGTRKPERVQAFTRSVPPGTTININFEAALAGIVAGASVGASAGMSGGMTAQMPVQNSYPVSTYSGPNLVSSAMSGDSWQFIQTDPMDEQGYY